MKSGDQFAKDINFQKVVFLHVNRILSSQDNPSFMRQVKLFELLMSPYMDDEFNIDAALNHYNEVAKLDEALKQKASMLSTAELELSEAKFSQLMVLSERKGLLLEKTDSEEEWDLPEEEDEEPKDDN